MKFVCLFFNNFKTNKMYSAFVVFMQSILVIFDNGREDLFCIFVFEN